MSFSTSSEGHLEARRNLAEDAEQTRFVGLQAALSPIPR